MSFGNIPHPRYERHIVPKPWVGAGYDPVPPRQILGLCMHKWWGYGDKLALVRLFGTGGERQADALTDYSLTQEGELVMLNEPEGARSPWANGAANDLEGDAVLFVRKLGVAAVNARLISVEFEGKEEPLTQAQLDVGSDLWAHWFDRRKVAWDAYPLHPVAGCVTDLDHYEFAAKECPFSGARGQRSAFQDLVRGKLRAAQSGGAPDPVPPPNPIEPDHDWLPSGMTEPMVRKLFGRGTRYNADGSTSTFEFDPAGVISNAWLSRGSKQGLYPSASNWWRLPGDTLLRNLVSFSNGWVLEGNDGDRSTWEWR